MSGRAALAAFLDAHRRVAVITGAGCSTASGIPDYRDDLGAWKRKPPVTLQAFVGDDRVRRRYWARSLVGWPAFGRAQPNAAHRALAALERDGRIEGLITQNVDRLHQRAGSTRVIDLHGRLDQVVCLGCGHRLMRESFQQALARENDAWAARWITGAEAIAPDGDADLQDAVFDDFSVPACRRCGGVLKPDVVFFGDNVPAARVREARAWIDEADALLVVGSSLTVYSGYRFVRQAADRGIPVAAVNRGVTRADPLLSLKIDARCEQVFTSPADG
ncbi:MAG: NAD-dependent protein deacetylase [Burkholderiaceae bacterium]